MIMPLLAVLKCFHLCGCCDDIEKEFNNRMCVIEAEASLENKAVILKEAQYIPPAGHHANNMWWDAKSQLFVVYEIK